MQDKLDALVSGSTKWRVQTQQGCFVCKRAKYSCAMGACDTTCLAWLLQLTWSKQNWLFYLVWSTMREEMACEASLLATPKAEGSIDAINPP